jgi:hypothetical protein
MMAPSLRSPKRRRWLLGGVFVVAAVVLAATAVLASRHLWTADLHTRPFLGPWCVYVEVDGRQREASRLDIHKDGSYDSTSVAFGHRRKTWVESAGRLTLDDGESPWGWRVSVDGRQLELTWQGASTPFGGRVVWERPPEFRPVPPPQQNAPVEGWPS